MRYLVAMLGSLAIAALTVPSSALATVECAGGATWAAESRELVLVARDSSNDNVYIEEVQAGGSGLRYASVTASIVSMGVANVSTCSGLASSPAHITLMVDPGDTITFRAADQLFGPNVNTTLDVDPGTPARVNVEIEPSDGTRPAVPFRIQLRADGFDMDGDGDTDIVLRNVSATSIDVTFSSKGGSVDIRQSQSAIRVTSIMAMLGWSKVIGSEQVVIDAPRAVANVLTGDGDDIVEVRAARGTVNTQGGNDNVTFEVQRGEPSVDAGSGNDVVSARTHSWANGGGISDGLNMGTGDDRLEVFGGRDATLHLGDGDDWTRLIAVKGYNVIFPGRGNDTVVGGMGYDSIAGARERDGAGNDRYALGAERDSVVDHWGSNIIDTGPLPARVDAGLHQRRGERDTIRTGNSDDLVVLYGVARVSLGGGNDELGLWGRARGHVSVDCGTGRDKADIFRSAMRRSCELQNLDDGGPRDAPDSYVHPSF